MTEPVAMWPKKQRELHNHHFDSTVWNDFAFRDDDVVIATYGKSGTTWLQQIVGQIVFDGAEDVDVANLSPWVDLRVPPKEVKLTALEAQTDRRFVKTHLPVDALVYAPEAKYIYVGRDGRDVIWSMYNHHVNANALWYQVINDTPGRVGPPVPRPPASTRDYFLQWLNGDGYPFWPFWSSVRSWWEIRQLPNLLMVHFADLKADLPGQISRIASFLGKPLDDQSLALIESHCRFDYMKAHAEKCAPLGGAVWEGGAATFVHKGTNGRWRDVLTPADCRAYEEAAHRELGEECARWLAEGAGAAQTPAAA